MNLKKLIVMADVAFSLLEHYKNEDTKYLIVYPIYAYAVGCN